MPPAVNVGMAGKTVLGLQRSATIAVRYLETAPYRYETGPEPGVKYHF